jgi:ABC-type ATPase involved in cell division
MDLTTGEMLFYCGLAGAGLSFLLAVITTIAFNIGRKKMRDNLEREYGNIS